MKTVLMWLLVGTISTTFAQKISEAELPAAVKQHFAKNFSKARDVEWKKEGSNYKVELELRNPKTDGIMLVVKW